ncbi:MAG: phage tail protein [Bacteroidales bacterium]|nr:phage tail protein [Bacteroidales bacterium]
MSTKKTEENYLSNEMKMQETEDPRWNEFVELSKSAMPQALAQDSVEVPKGAILMWPWNTPLPSGWAYCDGTNGTPDLRGRFVVGRDERHAEYRHWGNTGGQDSVKLSSTQQGTFNIAAMHDDGDRQVGDWQSIADIRINGTSLNKHPSKQGGIWGNTHTIPLSAAQSTHENRPPFYVLAYIIKL